MRRDQSALPHVKHDLKCYVWPVLTGCGACVRAKSSQRAGGLRRCGGAAAGGTDSCGAANMGGNSGYGSICTSTLTSCNKASLSNALNDAV